MTKLACLGQEQTFMPLTFTIIDSFSVSAGLRERGVDLPLGIWYVLEGVFQSADELPRPGDEVRILSLNGEATYTSISGAEVRHRSAAVSFLPSIENLERLSTFSLA